MLPALSTGPKRSATSTFWLGIGFESKDRGEYPAVTLTVAKRKGADASVLAEKVVAKVDQLKDR